MGTTTGIQQTIYELQDNQRFSETANTIRCNDRYGRASSHSYRIESIHQPTHNSNGLASSCAGTSGDLESDISTSLSPCCSSDDSLSSLFGNRLPDGFAPLMGVVISDAQCIKRYHILHKALLSRSVQFLSNRRHHVIGRRHKSRIAGDSQRVGTCRTDGSPTYLDFAIFFAKRAFMPIPGAPTVPLVALPSGAWGTTTFAACKGLCMG